MVQGYSSSFMHATQKWGLRRSARCQRGGRQRCVVQGCAAWMVAAVGVGVVGAHLRVPVA